MRRILISVIVIFMMHPALAQVVEIDDEAFQQVFDRQGETLIYNTENTIGSKIIDWGHSERLRIILEAHKDIKILKLHSAGGKLVEAIAMAEMIIDAGLDTHVDKQCNSSCLTMFLAGNKRTASLGAKFGSHRAHWQAKTMEEYYEFHKDDRYWETPFDFASWLYEDVQREVYEFIKYLTERGVTADIAYKTYRVGSGEYWYPTRAELLSSRILTE